MTQMDKFAALRRDWIAKGDPPCSHESVDKEYHLGSDTGDEGCLACGATWWRGQRPDALTEERDQWRDHATILRGHLNRAIGWLDQLTGPIRPDEEWLAELKHLDLGDLKAAAGQ
jgi:hypothetical protein